eukprot:11019937-Lingulodinium_polyedra.AAC.1
MALAALTGARRAGPALATTPRSRKVVAAGTPPPHAASHRLSAAVLANCRDLRRFRLQPTAASKSR